MCRWCGSQCLQRPRASGGSQQERTSSFPWVPLDSALNASLLPLKLPVVEINQHRSDQGSLCHLHLSSYLCSWNLLGCWPWLSFICHPMPRRAKNLNAIDGCETSLFQGCVKTVLTSRASCMCCLSLPSKQNGRGLPGLTSCEGLVRSCLAKFHVGSHETQREGCWPGMLSCKGPGPRKRTQGHGGQKESLKEHPVCIWNGLLFGGSAVWIQPLPLALLFHLQP